MKTIRCVVLKKFAFVNGGSYDPSFGPDDVFEFPDTEGIRKMIEDGYLREVQ